MKRKCNGQLFKERLNITRRLLSLQVSIELAAALEFKPRQQTFKINIAARELMQLHNEILNGLGRRQ